MVVSLISKQNHASCKETPLASRHAIHRERGCDGSASHLPIRVIQPLLHCVSALVLDSPTFIVFRIFGPLPAVLLAIGMILIAGEYVTPQRNAIP